MSKLIVLRGNSGSGKTTVAEETLERHKTKPNCREFGEAEMRRWWLEKDYSKALDEQMITQEKSLESIVSEIYAKVTGK